MKLYELADGYRQVQELYEEAQTEEDLQCLVDTLDAIQDSLEVKVENIASLMKNLEAEATMFKQEEERLAKARKSRLATVERLKNYLDTQLTFAGIKELKAGIFTCKYRKSESVEVSDLDKLPLEYVKVEYKPNKTEIKKAIKANQEVPGAALVENMNFTVGVK